MVDWNKTFKAEYAYVRTFLAHEANCSKAWQPLVRDLYKLMDTEGFDPGRASALADLRKQVTQGEGNVVGHKKITEDKGILTAVGVTRHLPSSHAVKPWARCMAPMPGFRAVRPSATPTVGRFSVPIAPVC